jgi:DNA repair exonuclease SbcCD ATPase subunit
MKLLRLKADGFGPLRGEFAFDPERLTLLVDENERGKSSLLAAISAGLYGLEDDRRSHRMMTPLERWRPWNGGSYRVELEVEHEGERLTVRRDFERGTVEVWSANGREVTDRFRVGKDEYPVGKVLSGLDAAEFEKCAFVRQNELDGVVPGDERLRRQSTLHARLENAADTRIGDTNATEALQVLRQAATSYTCDELGSTMKIESAIQRLEAKQGLLQSELRSLEHDLERIHGPLEELARLGVEEADVRERLAKLDAERHGTLIVELREKLRRNEEHRGDLHRLRQELESLRHAGQLPLNAEAELRETVARLEEARRRLDGLDARRREEQARERRSIESELESLAKYEGCTVEDADRFVALAAELRRLADEDERLRTEAFQLRDQLASEGHMPERVQSLTARFEGLTPDQERLMRSQNELQLQVQTEVAQLEQTRTECTETLREVDAMRHGRRLPGWVLTAVGLGTALAGLVLMAMKMPVGLWTGMLAAGAVCATIGIPLLIAGAQARAFDRELALRKLADAQRRLNQLRQQRAETEVGLEELSRRMGYRDPVELMRDWTEYLHLMDESAPVLRAQNQLQALKEQRSAALEEIRRRLERVGGGPPDPAHLERVASGIRLRAAGQKRLAELERGWGWIEEEKRVAEAEAAGLRERAIRLLSAAEIAYDPGRAWGDYVQRLAEIARGGQRHTILIEELIPQAERRMLPERQEADLRSQLEMLESEGGGAAIEAARSHAEIEGETREQRDRLDEVQRRRQDLRLQVEDAWRRHTTEHPEKSAELERISASLVRARRFKEALEIAQDTIQKVAVETHRRWADWLNSRVHELLASFGTGIEQVRFGEDLDFSVKLPGGQQVTRGRALAQLSAGARDQLHLAVRLAVSEYLSRGTSPLPLLIDDAFATSDDERARTGMKLLIEHFAKRHQVVMVTCHRGRVEALAAADPELYGSRVQILDARTALPT